MNPTTLTMAGHLAHAGAARPVAATSTEAGSGTYQASAWAMGAIAKTTAFVVLDGKNRPPRPPSELSP